MTSGVCAAETLDAEFVEMGELDGDAAEIVPHAAEDFFDLGVGFFRKRGAQLLAADAVFFEQRADPAHDGAGEIRHAPAVGVLDRAEKADRERAGSRVEQGLEARRRIRT